MHLLSICRRALLLAVAFPPVNALAIPAGEADTFYVSVNGNDLWSGRTPSLRAPRGPFASLTRARTAVRQSLAAGGHPTVRILEGVYRIDSTLVLGPSDSGTPEHPVVWSGVGSVRFSGGTALTGFRKILDPAVLKRLPPGSGDSVLVTDLPAQGIRDFGTPPFHMNVYFRGTRQQLARYPNRGWVTIADVPLLDSLILNPGDSKVLKEGRPAGRHSGRFRYGDNRPSRWAAQQNIWMHGYWVWDWRDAYQKVERIDTISHLIFPALPHHGYGYQKGQRYCYLNVLEELDTPGEWALDAERGLLYYRPPASLAPGDVTVSLLKEPMILLRGAANVQFRHLTLECSRACAVKIQGGTGNLVAGCLVRNIDNDTSLVVDGGSNNGARGCDVFDVGSTGIRVAGGDKRTLEAGRNFAINNHITRYGQVVQAFNGGIFLQGVGNILSHNRIHDAPFSGIQYYGNDHVIEYNEIFDLAHEAGDVGGINTGADYSDMGTSIRYNFIHDIHGPGEGGCRAIYLDLPGSNTTISGNIIVNVDIGVFFNSGRDNVVENNVFVNCHPSVNIYRWPHMAYFRPGGPWKIVEKLEAIRYTRPPYSTRYPKLPRYLDSADLGMPYGHSVRRNISTGGTWLDLSEGMDFSRVRVEQNVIADTMLLVLTRRWTPDYDPYHIGYAATSTTADTALATALRNRGNMLSDPRLVDPAHGDFRLRDDSPAWKEGFQRIPVEMIGLIQDEYRRLIPH